MSLVQEVLKGFKTSINNVKGIKERLVPGEFSVSLVVVCNVLNDYMLLGSLVGK